MTIETIARLLENSGFYIQKIEDGFLYIEDPSCILRGFQTFLEYAWIILFCVTALLFFGWAISLIRGATNDYFTNLRNLVIIFGVLSAIGPIINAIWGDDLFAIGCKTLVLSTKEIQKILDTQNLQLPKYNQYDLYENLKIQDSGIPAKQVSLYQ